jgi:8-hydroxy-5-deazaflavin:NADPH oxidoreductase
MRSELPRRALLPLVMLLVAPRARAEGGGPIRVGTIGAGRLGSVIGSLLVKAGHPVLFSSRHPENLKELVAGLGPLARAGTPAEAIAFGEVVLIAVPYGALPGIGRDYAKQLEGKVVLDACNAVPARDGEAAVVAKEKGIGLASADYLRGARVVRGFNTLGAGVLAGQAHRQGEKIAIPLAGDDQAALHTVSGLVRDAGFEPVVVGPLAKATEFAMGARGYGQQLDAQALRERLGLPQ